MTGPTPAAGGRTDRGWARFRRDHLFDYNAPAIRFWLAIVGCGALALVLAVGRLAWMAPGELVEVAGWIAIVTIAAAFPIQIPRSKHSIATGDVMIFLLLALYGGPPAAVAAAIEGLIGSLRSSKRVSSRIASMATASISMTLASALFAGAQALLVDAGLPYAAAHLAALALAGVVYFSVTTWTLVKVVMIKRGEPLGFALWFSNCAWVGTLTLVSAMLAGLLSLNAQQFGRAAVATSVLVIGLSLALLRAHFRQQIAAHEEQEARVRAAEEEAALNQRRFHSAFTHASIGMAIVAPDGRVLQANAALCTLLGYRENEVVQRAFRELLHPSDAALLDRHVEGVVARREDTFSIELRCLDATRSETWVSLHCALFDDQATAGSGLIFQLHDISSRRRAEGELHHIAYHDHLTDLANRSCLMERLLSAVERSAGDPSFGFALIYLDLDRFKNVNDSLGHPAGDELLKQVADRLAACVRPQDLVARLGGDEFCVLVEEVTDRDDVVALGDRLLSTLARAIVINGTEIRPMASIGITFSDMGYREPGEMLRDADLAMYRAKADGKGRVRVFDASMHEQLGHKLQLEADLRRAIGDGQLSLVFQPLYELDPKRLTGFEALARWVHPTRGAISPAVFIALAEETGCIEALTSWAIDEAVRQLGAWRARPGVPQELVVHVNVSGKDLAQPRLVAHVRDVLKRHAVPARLLTLEITESTFMTQRELVLSTLYALCELGVRLGIDDFGTGYSSLAYLSTLPFDCLKIDRSFVSGMEASPQNTEIVRTVLTLGRSLNKQVIAEGIETAEQLARLKQLGSPLGQGYLLGRPMTPAMIAERLFDLPVGA